MNYDEIIHSWGFLVGHLELPWPKETRQNWFQLDKLNHLRTIPHAKADGFRMPKGLTYFLLVASNLNSSLYSSMTSGWPLALDNLTRHIKRSKK
ncbi:hypothetical protein DERP_006582 [Dermatophagoides pteronyssinus]|uniref:Uncharacterized protein n=1 Tax=Dermatophagoides pteronyssinus TaxID=6956 RepID=A0ABQ8IQN6_DERPT|nr:hypothetical protein DERP_006582 [Dermatophagoides pteronyssinus]